VFGSGIRRLDGEAVGGRRLARTPPRRVTRWLATSTISPPVPALSSARDELPSPTLYWRMRHRYKPCFPLFPPLKKGRPRPRRGVRQARRPGLGAGERAAIGSVNWISPNMASGRGRPVRRTLSRVGLGSIIRVIGGIRFGPKAAVSLGF